jgi:hypothetical protein
MIAREKKNNRNSERKTRKGQKIQRRRERDEKVHAMRCDAMFDGRREKKQGGSPSRV